MIFDDAHSLDLLDFPRIRSALAGYCISPEGQALVESTFPLADPVLVRALKEDVRTLADQAREKGAPDCSFPDLGRARRVLSKDGMVLELQELYAVGLWARAWERLLDWLPGAREQGRDRGMDRGMDRASGLPEAQNGPTDTPVGDRGGEPDRAAWARDPLAAVMEWSPSLVPVAQIVFGVLTNDGELRDLPSLRALRDDVRRAERDIQSIAASYFRDPDLKNALQSGEPTLRDGRTVLAVRANFRGRVKGIVHEVSATGQTVFIEPAALVEKNNDLVQLDAALRAEIARILRDATGRLHAHHAALDLASGCMASIDARLARALQALRTGNILALDLESGFSLLRGRHPLLGAKAVPIDVDLPPGTRTLVVTGPNTGGKTVTLKTIGLFALMNQFGMALPAASETGFSVFDGVWADIGDEQSIDQSLSTFSGHMRVLGRIASGATGRSLVLLDELGAGTDPEEGCAVAMGLLDHFIEAGALTVVTTHHGILKNYGYTRPGCLNASMDFDAQSLSPTYRIVMGVPGESRALDIAAQNGLSRLIVENARRYLSEERTDVSELIKGLNEKHRELDSLETERRRRQKEAVEDQRRADLAALRVRRQELELRRKGVSEVQRLLTESRKTLENLVRELRETGVGEGGSLRTREVKGFIAELTEAAERQRALLGAAESGLEDAAARMEPDVRPQEAPAARGHDGTARVRDRTARAAQAGTPSAPDSPFAPGDEVLVGAARRPGRLIRRAGTGAWLVEVGSLKLSVKERELERARPAEVRVDYQVELAPRDGSGSARAAFELDLRGFRLHEALEAVERQIDAAALQGLQLFSIIHGTGEGILGRGIHEYLRGNPAVQDYHFARPEEGGYGKTVVRLK